MTCSLVPGWMDDQHSKPLLMLPYRTSFEMGLSSPGALGLSQAAAWCQGTLGEPFLGSESLVPLKCWGLLFVVSWCLVPLALPLLTPVLWPGTTQTQRQHTRSWQLLLPQCCMTWTQLLLLVMQKPLQPHMSPVGALMTVCQAAASSSCSAALNVVTTNNGW